VVDYSGSIPLYVFISVNAKFSGEVELFDKLSICLVFSTFDFRSTDSSCEVADIYTS